MKLDLQLHYNHHTPYQTYFIFTGYNKYKITLQNLIYKERTVADTAAKKIPKRKPVLYVAMKKVLPPNFISLPARCLHLTAVYQYVSHV